MRSQKEYNLKLNRLRNTRKMTRTMKLVSMSKLIKAQDNQRKATRYIVLLTDLIDRLAGSLDVIDHPLFNSADNKNNAHIVLFTSDRGLCGSFNNALIRYVNEWLTQNAGGYDKVYFSFCGRRGQIFFNRTYPEFKNYSQISGKPTFIAGRQIGTDLCQGLITKEFKDVFIAYNHFHSPLSQTPTIVKLLPIEPKPLVGETRQINDNYLIEPGRDQLISFLVPKYINFRVFYTLLENAAGEHGSRMTAMESATRNTEDMISRLTLMRNRARQAAITAELIEIISGAEALNQ